MGRAVSSTRSAFTLIELLVVLAIVSLLVALLLPALAQARAQARVIQCQSNLRQSHLGIQQYVYEHRELPPIIYNTQSNFPQRSTWFNLVAPYYAADYVSRGTKIYLQQSDANLMRYPMMQPQFRCPSTGGVREGVPWSPSATPYFWPTYSPNQMWGRDELGQSVNSGAWQWYHPNKNGGPFLGLPTRPWRNNGEAYRSIVLTEGRVAEITTAATSQLYYGGGRLPGQSRHRVAQQRDQCAGWGRARGVGQCRGAGVRRAARCVARRVALIKLVDQFILLARRRRNP